MSLKEAVLTLHDLNMMSEQGVDAVLSTAFVSTADNEDRVRFVEALASNGGDVLAAIIEAGAPTKDNETAA